MPSTGVLAAPFEVTRTIEPTHDDDELKEACKGGGNHGVQNMLPENSSSILHTTKFRGLVYSDPTCKLHDAFGLISDLVIPPKNERSIRSYVPRRYGKAVRKGIVEGLKQPINAMTGRYGPIPQLGGDFILGPGNVCTYAHRMKNTMDHLEVHDLMALADVQLPIAPPSHKPKQKRSQHSISYSFARPLMGDVDEDYGVCTLPPTHNSKPSSSGIPLWSSSASTKSAGGGGGGAHTPSRRRSPSHASTSNARPNTTTTTNSTTTTTTTPLEERWNGRPVSMILRGTGSESDLMFRAHQGLGVNAAVSAGIGGPGVVSGGYGYFDVGDVEEAQAASAAAAATTPAGGPGGTVWYSYAGADGKEEKDSYWRAAGGGSGGKEPISASGTDSSAGRGKKRHPNPFAAISVPVQTVPSSGLVPSPTTSGRPGTASGILGGEKIAIGKGEVGRPSTALGTRRLDMRSLSSASSSIPVLKKSSTPNKLKRSSTTTAVPTLITTTPASATSALTIPAGPPQFMSASPSTTSTSPPFSPTTPSTGSSPSRSPPTSPLKSPPTKKRSLTSASSTQPPSTGLGTHPPLSPSHSFALSFSSQAPSSAHPPSPMPPSSAASSSPPTPSMSSSPPRGAVNAKIIDPIELLSVDMDSWSNARSASRPTTAGGSSSIRSVILGEDGSAAPPTQVPAAPTPASIGRRIRQMSLSDGTRDDRR